MGLRIEVMFGFIALLTALSVKGSEVPPPADSMADYDVLLLLNHLYQQERFDDDLPPTIKPRKRDAINDDFDKIFQDLMDLDPVDDNEITSFLSYKTKSGDDKLSQDIDENLKNFLNLFDDLNKATPEATTKGEDPLADLLADEKEKTKTDTEEEGEIARRGTVNSKKIFLEVLQNLDETKDRSASESNKRFSPFNRAMSLFRNKLAKEKARKAKTQRSMDMFPIMDKLKKLLGKSSDKRNAMNPYDRILTLFRNRWKSNKEPARNPPKMIGQT